MKSKTTSILLLIAALAIGISAQTPNFQNLTSADLADRSVGDDLTRPRFVVTRDSGVKASVIVNTAAFEQTVFDLINQKRVESGDKPLLWSEALAVVARGHSQDMADHKYFSHRGLDNSMVSDRADRAGLLKWQAIGENIAFNRGYTDPLEKAVELWMGSTGHRQNLLDDHWRESAVGIAVASDGSYYFTQVFLLRK
jgi:uncharacterized protein YkwD